MGFLKKIKTKLEDFLQLEEEWKAWVYTDSDVIIYSMYESYIDVTSCLI